MSHPPSKKQQLDAKFAKLDAELEQAWWTPPFLTLYHYDSLPKKMQDNPYLLTAYRYRLTNCECLRSSFHSHNQTFNIWTSFFGIWIFMYGLLHTFSSMPLTWFEGFVLGSWFAANILMNIVSTLAHMFGHVSLRQYVTMFRIDGACVGCLVVSRLISITQYGFPLPTEYSTAYTIFSVLLIILCFGTFVKMRTNPEVPKSISVLLLLPAFLMLEWPLFVKMYYWDEYPNVYLSVIGQLVLLLGGFIYGSYIPERWAPTHFDKDMYSHPIWHICYIVACMYETMSILHDFCDVKRQLATSLQSVQCDDEHLLFFSASHYRFMHVPLYTLLGVILVQCVRLVIFRMCTHRTYYGTEYQNRAPDEHAPVKPMAYYVEDIPDDRPDPAALENESGGVSKREHRE